MGLDLNQLTSNKAITKAYDFLSKGAKASNAAYKTGKTAGDLLGSVKAGHMMSKVVEEGGKQVTKQVADYGAIAGSYIAASAVGRVATGGGLTRDRNGNSNIIGIPFV